MTNTTMGSLREIQRLDDRIREIRARAGEFDERLAAVEEPALALEGELSQLRERLSQMEADERRLERSADDKRARAEKLEARLTRVSNLREEAAVKAELDLIVKAISADEQEALQLLDQIRRTEAAEEELSQRTNDARASVEPQQADLLKDRETLFAHLEEMRARREEVLDGIQSQERRVYEAFYQSGRPVIVASLLDDGACGHCFGVVPLQTQNEVRQGTRLIRCEGCGVILTTEPELEPDPSLTEPILLSTDVTPDEDEDEAGVSESGTDDASIDGDRSGEDEAVESE